MNRLALTALATAVLGTGCYIDNSGGGGTGTVNVYWDFVRTAPAHAGGRVVYDQSLAAANVRGICPESDVDTVRVISDAGTQDVACTGQGQAGWVQGLVVHGVPSGTSTVTVEGYRSSTLVYQGTRSVSVRDNGVTDLTIDALGVRRPLEIYAYLRYATPAPGGNYLNCGEASSPNLDYVLYDSFGTKVDSGTVGCSNPFPAIVYQQDLDLDTYRLYLRGLAVAGGAVVFDTVGCLTEFNHYGAQVGASGISSTLQTLPVPNCP